MGPPFSVRSPRTPLALNTATAAEYYGDAMTLDPELEMRPLVAHCHLGLGRLYRRLGDPEQAQERLTTADGDVRPARHDALAVDAAEDRMGTFVFRFKAIGTQWEIETPEPLGRPLRRRVLERIQQFDTTYSRLRPDSVVARVAAAPDGGRFDFLIGRLALLRWYLGMRGPEPEQAPQDRGDRPLLSA
jgi:hypothetical protein